MVKSHRLRSTARTVSGLVTTPSAAKTNGQQPARAVHAACSTVVNAAWLGAAVVKAMRDVDRLRVQDRHMAAGRRQRLIGARRHCLLKRRCGCRSGRQLREPRLSAAATDDC